MQTLIPQMNVHQKEVFLYTHARAYTNPLIYLKEANRGDCKERADTVDQPLPRVENPSTEAVNHCVHPIQII